MNELLHFTEMDIAILYSIPGRWVSLDEIIRYYSFVNRDRAPSREELERCLGTALAVGAMMVKHGRFLLYEEWFERLHRFDESTENEIDSLLEVTELLEAETWERISHTGYSLSQDEYDSAIRQIKSSGFKWLL